MLVLLVIFMVTAPMLYNGITLTLPKTQKVNRLNLSDNQVILSVSSGGEFFVGSEKFLQDEIIKVLASKLSETKSNVLYIRAHYNLRYGKVAKLMSFLKANGITNLALVTEVEN